jgi:hypothetical protein
MAQRMYQAYHALLSSPRWQRVYKPGRVRNTCSGRARAPGTLRNFCMFAPFYPRTREHGRVPTRQG